MATVTVYRYDNLEGETFDDKYAESQGYANAEAMADALVSGASYHRTQKAAQDDADGVSTSSSVGTAATSAEANQQAQALYSFMPQGVLDDFINNYIDTGDADISIGLTRKSQVWKDNFSHLLNKDGTLIIDEITSLTTINTYKQTLKEIGIDDFTEFEDEFKEMVSSVSGAEFQDRIDVVYEGVVNQIPEVKQLFAEQLGVVADDATIFAALINPKVEDKFLKGQITTVQIGAQAKKAGFGFNYDKFDTLKKQGLTAQGAKQLYGTAGNIMSQAESIGRDLGIETLEQASLGNVQAQQRLTRIESELMSKQGIQLGAAKKDGKITGLTT